ncbi:MAG: flagellar hook-associated protein FlgK [Betaproteobacteria bacterium]|nr:flagellar hook-associated protein FlgK [Betaproteobacteria bacterium]
MSILNVGITGLGAAQLGIQTTGHNIANASTPGYNRQQNVQTTAISLFTGAGFFGQGTAIATVKRVYDAFLANQVLSSQTSAAETNTYSAQISQIDNLLADPSAGLSPALQAFFNAVDAAGANPSSIPARQAMLSGGQSLASRFQSLNQRIEDIRQGVNQQISSTVVTINSYVKQLADMNQRITVAQAAGDLQPANDLNDQRDKLLSDLNKEIRVTSHTETDGSLSVFFGSGQPLLIGISTYKLQAVPGQDDLSRVSLSLQGSGNAIMSLPESLVSGGNLGGLLQFRSQTLDAAQNSLGRVATVLGATFNAQHMLGQDMTGALGGAFFSTTPPTQMVLSSLANTGAGSIALSFNSYQDLGTSDYRLTKTSANSLTLLRLSDNASWTGNGSNDTLAMADLMTKISPPSPPGQPQGFSLSPSGLINVNDSFLIRPTRLGAHDISVALGDARNVALASPLRTAAAVTNAGTAQISAGTVSSSASVLAAPFTLSYEAASTSLAGFPAGATVDVAGQIYKITGPTMRVPYTSGANISVDGVGVKISGAPVDGDTFTINPISPQLFGTPTQVNGGTLGSVTPTTPYAVVAGVNDQFNISVDGKAIVTATLAPGSYATPQALAAQLQTSINTALGAAIPAQTGTVTVTTTASNQILINSNLNSTTTIPSVVLSALPSPANTGIASLFGAVTTTTRGASIGSLAPATPTPLTLTLGVNDKFDIAVDGGAVTTMTVAAGVYSTPAALAAAIQTAIGGGVTVSVDPATNRMVVNSPTTGAGSSIALTTTAGNTGLAAMFGTPTAGNRGMASGAVVPTNPLVILAGTNDRFRLGLDGGGSIVATIPAGSYTPASLASQLQTSLNALVASPAGVTVTLNGGGQLVVTSNQVGGTSAITLSAANLGSGAIVGAAVTSTNTLPAAPVTLKYLQASTSPALPARLTGLPVGSIVTVTPVNGGAPTSYTIYRPTDYIPYTSASSIAFNGISFSISGPPVDGDTFTFGPNPTGVSDNRNAILLSGLQTKNTIDAGNSSYQSAYSQIVSQIGNKARELQVGASALDNLVKQGQDAIQSESGVNLDEEAANMLRYQQAYQASAKMIDVAGKLFDQLLLLGR